MMATNSREDVSLFGQVQERYCRHSSLCRSTQLNNNGVALIEKGRYEDAIFVLTKSLTLTKQVILGQDEECCKVQESGSYDHIICDFVPMEAVPTNIIDSKNSDSRDQTLRRYNSIFTNPIEIIDISRGCCPRCYSKFLFVHVYNLALSHQLLSMQVVDPQMRASILRKALKLYELAHNVHIEESADHSVFEVMVIINNIAEIHIQLTNEMNARKCIQQLEGAIMFLVVNGENEILQQLEVVVSNVLSRSLPDSHISPAA